VGAMCADAAAQTSHWNYAREEFHKALAAADCFDTPEFFVKNGFYTVAVGGHSCYGDQCLEYARHLAEHKTFTGESSHTALVDRLSQRFGDGSTYGQFPPPEGKPAMPIPQPWRHGSIKGFLSNHASGRTSWPTSGSDDSQADCFVKTVPVVCAFAGQPELMNEVERAVRVTQNHDDAVAYAKAAARVLEACILGEAADLTAALAVAQQRLQEDNTGSESSMPAAMALELVQTVLASGPADFPGAVGTLGGAFAMQPFVRSPASLVA